MRVTASKTALWLICGYSAREDVPRDADRPSEYRNFGLALHDALEIMHQGWDPDLLAIADKRALTTAQRLALPRAIDALREVDAPRMAQNEVAWALDLDTGEARILGTRIGRAYKEHGAREGIDFCGSIDLAWMATQEAFRGYVEIVDLKSGFEGRVADHLPQLMSNAAALARAWGARGAKLSILHLHEGEVRWDTVVVEDYELDAHVALLQERRRETPTAEPVPGPHCRDMYCTAVGACPAGQRAIAALVPAERLTAKLTGTIESDEEAAARAALLPLLEERIEQYREELRDWARAHGGCVKLPDGQYYGEYTSERREIEPTPEAMAVLAEELGDEGAQHACQLAVTQTSIRRQLETLGIKPPSAALARILERLERAGALKTKERKTWDFRFMAPRARKPEALPVPDATTAPPVRRVTYQPTTPTPTASAAAFAFETDDSPL